MFARGTMFAVGSSALAFACVGQPNENRLNESQEIIENSVQAPFATAGIMIASGAGVVERHTVAALGAQRDLNGDGRADVCGRGIGGIICAVSTGTMFAAA